MTGNGAQNAKSQISQLESEMAELQSSSKELERILEQELEESETRMKELERQIARANTELTSWRNRYTDLQREYTNTHTRLIDQLTNLSAAHKQLTNKLREVELANDDMERSERIIEDSLRQSEQNYMDALEQIAFLEAELSAKGNLEITNQRLRDELRDTNEELARLKELVCAREKVPLRSASDHQHTQGKLPSSGSLLKIHRVLSQVRTIESRVASFKLSLPLQSRSPRSPGHPASPGSPSPSEHILGKAKRPPAVSPSRLDAATERKSSSDSKKKPIIKRSKRLAIRPYKAEPKLSKSTSSSSSSTSKGTSSSSKHVATTSWFEEPDEPLLKDKTKTASPSPVRPIPARQESVHDLGILGHCELPRNRGPLSPSPAYHGFVSYQNFSPLMSPPITKHATLNSTARKISFKKSFDKRYRK